jgi:hypothetical protein
MESCVRTFYESWLICAGLKPHNKEGFDKFVEHMESMIGDYLTDQCMDYNSIGVERSDE